MDPILILIVIVLLVVAGAFVAALRGSSGGGRVRPVAVASATPPPVQQAPPASTTPVSAPVAPARTPTTGPPAASTAPARAPVPESAPTTSDREDASPAAAVAETPAPDTSGVHDAEEATSTPAPQGETGALPPLPHQPPATPDTAPSAVSGEGVVSPLAAVSQPPTRSGEIRLQVAPQRLPYRFAELVGEQRQLEEAITLLHRRIDDVELDVEPSSYENRVRLGVLRQELAQRQERLREILFLQDGYRWLQQHMALDRAPGETPAG